MNKFLQVHLNLLIEVEVFLLCGVIEIPSSTQCLFRYRDDLIGPDLLCFGSKVECLGRSSF